MSENSRKRRSLLTAPIRISAEGRIEERTSDESVPVKPRPPTVPPPIPDEAKIEAASRRTRKRFPTASAFLDREDDAPGGELHENEGGDEEIAMSDSSDVPPTSLRAIGSSRIVSEVIDSGPQLENFFSQDEVDFFSQGDRPDELPVEFQPEPQLSTRIRDWLKRSFRRS